MAEDSTKTDPQTLDVEFTPEPGLEDRLASAPGPENLGSDGLGAGNDVDRRRGAAAVVKDEAGKLTGQAGERIRSFADDGKARATGALGELAKAIGDAAGTIDEKVGPQFGGYARSASSAVSDFSRRLEDRDVDDLIADAKAFVRKSPGVAIGAAAAAGFVFARLLWSGVDANRDA